MIFGVTNESKLKSNSDPMKPFSPRGRAAAGGGVARRLVALVLLALGTGSRAQVRVGLVLLTVALVLRSVRLLLGDEGRRWRVALTRLRSAGVARRRGVRGLLPGGASLGQRLILTTGLEGRF